MGRFGKYLGEVVDSAAEGKRRMGKVVGAPLDLAASATAGLGKRMTKKTDPSIANLWTGRRESGLGIVAAVGVGAAYGTYQGFKETALAPKIGETSYTGAPQIMNADGVSTNPQAPTSNAPTLGAGGNMVFGLHNARKG